MVSPLSKILGMKHLLKTASYKALFPLSFLLVDRIQDSQPNLPQQLI